MPPAKLSEGLQCDLEVVGNRKTTPLNHFGSSTKQNKTKQNKNLTTNI
jgi:hypothetical protein